MTARAIEVVDLTMTYGDLRAVDGISLEVAEGEFVGILGPNGAGKTTALETIEGLRQPDSGTVTVLGLPVWPRNPALLPRIGVQLQASSFFERLTAREQIHTFASLYGVGAKAADEWLETVGLDDKADTRVEDLSGGQAQRLSIACALVHDPEVLFLDEPTAALDPQARRNLWDLLSGLNDSGRTVVLTTHYMDEAEVLCDRVAIMDHGKILQFDTPAALVRGLDAPARITVAPGQLTLDEAQAPRGSRRRQRGCRRRRADHPRAGQGGLRPRRRPTTSTASASRPAPSRTSSSTSPAGSTAHEGLPGAVAGDRQGLPPRQVLGVLRGHLPADVPGALRRHLQRPDPVEGRPDPGRRREPGRRPARRREGRPSTRPSRSSRPTTSRPRSARSARATPTWRSRCRATPWSPTTPRPTRSRPRSPRARCGPSSTAPTSPRCRRRPVSRRRTRSRPSGSRTTRSAPSSS